MTLVALAKPDPKRPGEESFWGLCKAAPHQTVAAVYFVVSAPAGTTAQPHAQELGNGFTFVGCKLAGGIEQLGPATAADQRYAANSAGAEPKQFGPHESQCASDGQVCADPFEFTGYGIDLLGETVDQAGSVASGNDEPFDPGAEQST